VPFVYLLRCGDGSLYAGAAMDLARRLAEHLAGRASRYTRTRLPVEIVWSLQVESWGDALREEFRLKQLSRAEKDELLRASAAPALAAAAAPDEPPS
jgi:putative endonuclease